MTDEGTLARLRARLADDPTGVENEARLVHALESIGWRGSDSASAEEVAAEILPALRARAGGLRDVHEQIAGALRLCGPLLDGGLPPVSAYVPAAEEVVRIFLRA